VNTAGGPYLITNFPAFVSVDGIPDDVKDMLVVKAFEDAIATKDDEVMEIWFQRELRNFRLGHDYSRFSTVFLELGLYISNRP